MLADPRPQHFHNDLGPVIGRTSMLPTAVEDMESLAGDPPHPSSPPFRRRRKSWARTVERICCQTLAYFPLTFVYGLSTWAIYVEVQVSFIGSSGWLSYLRAALGILLYGLANVSYTIAVFTPPGSPVDPRTNNGGRRHGGGYEGLPTYEDDDPSMPTDMSTVTAKSTGKPRYCKKCRTVKPDRTHHCSTCKKCVLKMDHHCPWLATCVGLRNYKAFLLFLVYTSLFCWTCFGVSAVWVWAELVDQMSMAQGWAVVNTILLAVLGGIIGLVLSGFTGWHIYLAFTGQTTIESLEKTRYLTPLRKSLEHRPQPGRHYLSQGDQPEHQQTLTEHLKDIHANALPGILRPEEGEEHTPGATTPVPQAAHSSSNSPAHDSLRRSYASLEAQREQDRYDAYLDEQDSEKLPNAFDLGRRRNLRHLFGDRPLLWALPVCNTTGDGWQWEVSGKWLAARDDLARARAHHHRETAHRVSSDAPASQTASQPSALRWTPGQGFVDPSRPMHSPHTPPPPPRPNSQANGHPAVQMQPLDRRKGPGGAADDHDACATSSDEEARRRDPRRPTPTATADWNDVPEDFLAPRASARRAGSRSRSRGRTKGD